MPNLLFHFLCFWVSVLVCVLCPKLWNSRYISLWMLSGVWPRVWMKLDFQTKPRISSWHCKAAKVAQEEISQMSQLIEMQLIISTCFEWNENEQMQKEPWRMFWRKFQQLWCISVQKQRTFWAVWSETWSSIHEILASLWFFQSYAKRRRWYRWMQCIFQWRRGKFSQH